MQWNLGGQDVKLLDLAAVDVDIAFVQEVARGQEGWNEDDTDHFHWVTYRSPALWRGVGIGVAGDKLDCVVSKAASSRGIWILAKLRGLGRVVLGCLHAHTGVTNGVYQAAVLEFIRSCPGKWRHYPLLAGFDVNEVPCWNEEAEALHLGSSSSNLNLLTEQANQLGIEPKAPEVLFKCAPTHFPRDASRSGRQIDMLWGRHVLTTPVTIDAERRHTIGTDHAALIIDVWGGGASSYKWGNDSRARFMVGDLPDTVIVDADDLIKMAKVCTAPRRGQSYKDPAEVKEAIFKARTTGDPQKWKKVHKLRRRAKREWQAARLTRILNGDWEQYRALQREKARKKGWWGRLLENNTAQEITSQVLGHLKEKMTDDNFPDWDDILQDHIDSVQEDDVFVDFSILEVRTALQEMKPGAAVGPDGLGVHFLKAVANDDRYWGDLLGLINHIVEHQATPTVWEENFLALLAKTDLPHKPADLRPICVSSAFHKLINKMVCARALPHVRCGSRVSGCGKGRQAADVIGALCRVKEVVQEWKLPALVCKLDIAGAFDRLDRLRVIELLKDRLREAGVPHELRYLLAQLKVYTLKGTVPGGNEIEIHPNVGIKQGAPESAELFGLVMEAQLASLVDSRGWKQLGPCLGDLDFDLAFYQDDIFVVESELPRLCKRIKVLDRLLQKSGLRLATQKTKIVASKYYVGVRKVQIDQDIFKVAMEEDTLKVLGLDFNLTGPLAQQARELLGRTRRAAAVHRDLLRGQAAWMNKVKMMSTLVASQFHWTAGAIYWGAEELKQANTLQLHIMRSAFRIGRRKDESWVSWNTRSMRECRQWLAYNRHSRWSTFILTLQHTLHGHWARRVEEVGWPPRQEPCLTMRTLAWRNSRWWRAQQALGPRLGTRHKGHVYISNTERQLAEVHGTAWHLLANDRARWSQERTAYLERWDPKWSHGRQLSVQN